MSRALLVFSDVADSLGRLNTAILLLGKPHLNVPSIVQAIAECERNAMAAVEHAQSLRLRIAATPDLDKKVG